MSDLALKEETAVSNIKENQKRLLSLANALLALPPEFKDELEVMHHALPGVYVRTVLMKAGQVVVGRIHKYDHIAIISAGKALVTSADFEEGPREIKAPFIFKSAPGAMRGLLILEDCVWTTIHSNPDNKDDWDDMINVYSTIDPNEVSL